MSPASRPCSPCASRGRTVPATRVMLGGMGKCDDCFRNQVEPLPRTATPAPKPAVPAERAQRYESAPAPREEKTMPVKKEIDWIAVQNDRSDGMAGTAICKKYGISSATLYTKTKPAPGKKARARVLPAPRVTPRANGSAAKPNGAIADVDISDVIAKLERRRDKINATIATLRELELA